MLEGLTEWVRSRFAPSDADKERRFRPSLLDRSVLFAHGSGRNDVDRELAEVQENANELEEHRRK
ncbi:hypothetical protein [Halorhabdus sp. CUG00001]|uniref:hypothetical protein n=1 Tax=Halorhabdus sp. CUG00001 TaxID=2600297 RepID=UPI00131DCC3A|nr:hypothetical protein [Halorhabdus sp. CUG00001]